MNRIVKLTLASLVAVVLGVLAFVDDAVAMGHGQAGAGCGALAEVGCAGEAYASHGYAAFRPVRRLLGFERRAARRAARYERRAAYASHGCAGVYAPASCSGYEVAPPPAACSNCPNPSTAVCPAGVECPHVAPPQPVTPVEPPPVIQ
jgi:hypothetical protein